MAAKRKLEYMRPLSRIPSLSDSAFNISSIREADKENVPGTLNTAAAKKIRIETSTPKPSKTTASGQETFKVPKPLGVRPKAPVVTRPKTVKRQPAAPQSSALPPVAAIRQATVMPTSTTQDQAPKAIKRPKWDLKGRVNDLEDKLANLLGQNKEKAVECEEKSTLLAGLKSANEGLNLELQITLQRCENLQQQLAATEAELRTQQHRSNTLQLEVERKTYLLQETQQELKQTVQRNQTLNVQLQANVEEHEQLQVSFANLENSLVNLKDSYDTVVSRLEDTEKVLRFSEDERKKLHNAVLELKDNIRVFCRVRPTIQNEESPLEYIQFLEDGQSLAITKPLEVNETGAGKNRPKLDFKFDKVFPPQCSQNEVFEEISQLVQSTLDGYNICIFAYGQTGSGKTFTLEGPAQIQDFVLEYDNSMLGMIPRSVTQVFTAARNLTSRGWTYTMEVSILEIYNEILRDLLGSNTSSSQLSLQKGTDHAMAASTIRRVSSEKEVYALLKKARRNRAVAATSCNKYSSRSHSIFRLKIIGHNKNTEETTEGTLNLVDLAGSERLRELTMDRANETKNINKSLSNLGNVIMALSQKAAYVPYRNSKLTQILMNSLGGNSKTLMFVNVSPNEGNYSESINALRFGTKVNNCNIGTATKVVK